MPLSAALVGALAFGLAAAGWAATGSDWSIVRLDGVGFASGSPWDGMLPTAINNHGQVVGQGRPPNIDSLHAFVWQGGRPADLSRGDPQDSSAAAINDRGRIVGWTCARGTGPPCVRHAALWLSGQLQDLGVLAGDTQSAAFAINRRDEIAGDSYGTGANGGAGTPRAFLWRNGAMIDLGTLGGHASHAAAINDAGQVVGWSETKSGVRHAFSWQDGQMHDLGTFGGGQSEAVAINSRGEIVGISFASPLHQVVPRAYLRRKAVTVALGRLCPRDGGSYAIALNDRGEVAGCRLTNRPRTDRAFRWADGRLTDLAVPRGVTSSSAAAINNAGQVTGSVAPLTTFPRPAVWGRDNTITVLPVLPLEEVWAHVSAINDRGEVTGYLSQHMDSSVGVLWKHR